MNQHTNLIQLELYHSSCSPRSPGNSSSEQSEPSEQSVNRLCSHVDVPPPESVESMVRLLSTCVHHTYGHSDTHTETDTDTDTDAVSQCDGTSSLSFMAHMLCKANQPSRLTSQVKIQSNMVENESSNSKRQKPLARVDPAADHSLVVGFPSLCYPHSHPSTASKGTQRYGSGQARSLANVSTGVGKVFGGIKRHMSLSSQSLASVSALASVSSSSLSSLSTSSSPPQSKNRKNTHLLELERPLMITIADDINRSLLVICDTTGILAYDLLTLYTSTSTTLPDDVDTIEATLSALQSHWTDRKQAQSISTSLRLKSSITPNAIPVISEIHVRPWPASVEVPIPEHKRCKRGESVVERLADGAVVSALQGARDEVWAGWMLDPYYT